MDDEGAREARLPRQALAEWDYWHWIPVLLVEPFRKILARGPTQTSVSDRPFQPATVIEHWLLGRLYATRIACGRDKQLVKLAAASPGAQPGNGPP